MTDYYPDTVDAPPERERSPDCDKTPAGLALPPIVYCVKAEEAESAVHEVVADARGWPVALDIETTPALAEVERLRECEAALARLRGARKAAKRTKAPPAEIEAFGAEEKLLQARIKYTGKAGLDPSRA